MTDFLSSLKADLLDRRLLPLVAVVTVAVAAAIAYVVLGGGSSATSSATSVATGPAVVSGLAISQTTPEKAVAETTSGVSAQHRGVAHNPFTPLPEPAKKTAAATAAQAASRTTSTSSSSSTTSTSGSSSPSSGGSTPTTPTKPSTAKPKTVYQVAVMFGVFPAGATPQSVQLTPYENLKLLTPLPSATQPLIVFRGVTAARSAIFTLVGEAILHGSAVCLPSASQCEAIALKEGQTEQLEYLPPNGQVVTYELRVVSIASTKASTAQVKGVLRGESKAGGKLLSRAGLVALPGLRYSPKAGVLVFTGHRAFSARSSSARARAAAQRRRSR